MSDHDYLGKIFSIIFTYFNKIGYVIVIPIICIIGLILNILCFIVFFGLKEKIFLYLRVKSLAESFLLLIGAISPFVSCDVCSLKNTYLRAIITLITNKFLLPVVYSLITILEIEIAFNRYFIVKSRDANILIEKKDKLKVFGYTIISFSLVLPYLFAHKIEKDDYLFFVENEYILNLNDFGKSQFFYYFHTFFILIVYFALNFLSVLIILPLNVVIIIEFRKFMKKKFEYTISQIIPNNSSRTNPHQNAKIKSRKFTIMIITISFLFMFSRLLEAVVFSFSMYNNYIASIKYFEFYYTILNVFVHANTYIIFSLNFFIFYWLNSAFKKQSKIIFCCSKDFVII